MKTYSEHNTDIMRRQYLADIEHARKLRAIIRFLTLYAVAGFITAALIAYSLK